MPIRIEFALSAAIILAITATTSAAPKQRKPAVQRSVPYTAAAPQRAVRFSDPNSPEATGGGSLG